MLQIDNKSRFVPMVNLLADETGVDTLFVVVRGTFDLMAATPKLAAQQLPPVAGDVYWGEPGASSLKYPSEVHVGKQGTDVALVGHAHAARGRAVTEMLAALTVAGRQKVVRVSGDRTWRGPTGGPTLPEPFRTMPLVYERAFGGRHDDGAGRLVAEERNPVGIGFRGHRAPGERAGQRLPNLEDPKHPLTAFGDVSPPASFGFVAASWQPRRARAGTYDEAWRKARAPYLPTNFDRRFDNAACTDLTFEHFLVGGEPLSIIGMSEEGPLSFSLPTAKPRVEIAISGTRATAVPQLETILIEPDARRLSLSWRAAVPCDKRALKIQMITIEGGE